MLVSNGIIFSIVSVTVRTFFNENNIEETPKIYMTIFPRLPPGYLTILRLDIWSQNSPISPFKLIIDNEGVNLLNWDSIRKSYLIQESSAVCTPYIRTYIRVQIRHYYFKKIFIILYICSVLH